MKVELKDLTETRKQLVVAFDAEEIDAEEARVTGEFARMARIPGFRPGKAPASVVKRRYGKDIARELKQAVISKAYREGIQEAKVDVLTIVDLDDPTVAAGSPAEIVITLDVNPSFELPEYKGLPVTAGDLTVKPEEIDEVIENIRRERADYNTVERAAEQGDYVKFSFEGTIDGQPIAEIAKERPIYGSMPQTWEEAGSEEGLLPGMGKHLIGLKAGDEKEVSIEFPADFHVGELAGKIATYSVKVQEVRERVLPELDEQFLQAQGVSSVEELRSKVEESLKGRKEAEDRANRRRQVMEELSRRVDFPIPESLIDSEADQLVHQIVEQNIRQGIPQEELEKNKDEIFATARKNAIERVKVRMLLLRIAEKEEIKLERDDMNRAIVMEAMRARQKPEKFVKELEKNRDRLRAIQQDVLIDKALDFLVEQATVSASS